MLRLEEKSLFTYTLDKPIAFPRPKIFKHICNNINNFEVNNLMYVSSLLTEPYLIYTSREL
jgi:hypothetical protein